MPTPTAHRLKQTDCKESVYFFNAARTVRNTCNFDAGSFKSSLTLGTFHCYIQAYTIHEAFMGSTGVSDGIIFQGGCIPRDKIKRDMNLTVL
jgi:hypothetical protein